MAIILDHTRHYWGVDELREFQIQAICHGIFHDETVMYVAEKNGYGKSLIPITIASIRKGITIVLVLLIGLGSDQVAKSMFANKGIEAYHVDEHQTPDDAKLLRD